jgi:hypothetical protein
MSKIALDKLEAGMKLAKPVENSSGMVLLGENTELTVELIDKIKDMGIDSVYVRGLRSRRSRWRSCSPSWISVLKRWRTNPIWMS